MFILLLFAVLIITSVSLPAMKLTKKYKDLSKWDYIYPCTGIPLWFVLTMLRIGKTASLSNFVIENFWIAVVSITTPWTIFFLYSRKNKAADLTAKTLTVFPIVFTIILRLLIETLPE